jgi:hypothetical protein
MRTYLLPALAVVLLSLAACGGESSDSSESTGGAGMPTVPAGDGHLKVTIDGKDWVCEGRIKNEGMTLNKKDLHLVLVGKLPADGDRAATNLHVVLVKKTRDDGRYDLISNQVSLDVMEGKLAYVKIFTSGAKSQIEGRKGSLTFTKLVTTEEGFTNYGVLHAAGTFEGTFGKGDKESAVKGSFEFIRRR